MLCVIYYIDQVCVPQPGVGANGLSSVDGSGTQPNVS